MSPGSHPGACLHADRVSLYVLHALPAEEHAAMSAHLAECPECRLEMDTLAPVLHSLSYWPTDVLRPSGSLWQRLSSRMSAETPAPRLAADNANTVPELTSGGREPDWEQRGPGMFCKLLAVDSERSRVSMMVRLSPGAEYPPHTHADIEELHLLDGELRIDGRELVPGDYVRSEPGSSDQHVWSESGCTCVLVTSTHDVLL